MTHVIDNKGPHFVPQLAHSADSALDGVCVRQAGQTEGVSASPGGWIPMKLIPVLSAKMEPYHFA